MFQLDQATLAKMRERWRSMKHVGDAKPYVRAWVRTGALARSFQRVPQKEVYSHIPNWEGMSTIWQGRWNPKDIWVELPNVQMVEPKQDFTQKGMQGLTITLDNIAMTARTGVAGVYHMIERGFYAPFRGYATRGQQEVGTQNEWFDVLNDRSTEIVIVAGFGPDAAIPIFKGLVDDVDMTSRPDVLTVQTRDHGMFLTDQKVFLNAKVKNVPDPITFADRLEADDTQLFRGGVEASSHENGRQASFAVDEDPSTSWQSAGHDNAGALEFIQMHLTHGRYESFHLQPQYQGMSCYVAILPTDKNAPGGKGACRNYTQKLPSGWVDEGLGNVPGTNIPFVKFIPTVKAKDRAYWLRQYGYMLGDDSILRLYFTNLAKTHKAGQGAVRYRAGVKEFAAVDRQLPQNVKKAKWLLVDDVSDVVKTVLQWCGLDHSDSRGTGEWEIESAGVRLADKLVWNRGNDLIEIIDKMCELTGFVFFMKPPSAFDDDDLSVGNPVNLSMGTPVFRSNQAMVRPQNTHETIEEVHEDRLLQGINAHFSGEPLAYNIRVRGKRRKKKKGGRHLGGDKTPRWMYVYRPPWSRGNPDFGDAKDFQNANLKKYVVHHDEQLDSLDECKIAAILIAFKEALEAYKATVEFPFMPSIFLDSQLRIRDLGTGLMTRMWVVDRAVRIRTGEDPEFKMTVGGSLIEVPDIVEVREELVQALADAGYNPGLSSWELSHYGSVYEDN